LGARLDGIEEVRGSNPLGSTNFSFIHKGLPARIGLPEFQNGACLGICVGLLPVENRERG
jgi:hypothetical protein